MTEDTGGERGTYRGVRVTTRSKAGALALAIAVLALGGVFIVFGLVLLVSLAAVGTLVGAGVVAYNRLTGRWPRFLRRGAGAGPVPDPSLEVFPEAPRAERHNDRLPTPDPRRPPVE